MGNIKITGKTELSTHGLQLRFLHCAVFEVQADLIQRKLFTVHYHIYAAPAYLARAGKPDSFEDLAAHQLIVYGEVRSEGDGSEIMGGPLVSLRWLVQHAAEQGEPVGEGDLVIPGSAVHLIRVFRGDRVEARFSTLGSCRASLA